VVMALKVIKLPKYRIKIYRSTELNFFKNPR